MSFFDEPVEPYSARRSAAHRGGSSGRGRRPPGRRTIAERRAVAAVAILVVVVLIALGVRSCQVSARNSSLENYNNNVSALIKQSEQTGSHLFGELGRGVSVAEAIAKLRDWPGVAYAAPNYIAHEAGVWIPDNPGRAHRPGGWEAMQWNVLAATGVNAPQAWANLIADYRPSGRGVTVAILDAGSPMPSLLAALRH